MAVITLRQLLHRPSPGGPISPDDPLPTRLYGGGGAPLNLPTLAKQQEILEALGPLATEEKLELVRALIETLEGKAATETTLAQVLAKLSDDPATAAGQTAITDAVVSLAGLAATEGTLAQAVARLESILARLESTLDISDRENRKLGEVTLTGHNTVIDVVTVINAQTVLPSGNTGFVSVPVGDANAIMFLINSTQPWRIVTNSPWSDLSTYSVFLYPNPSEDKQANTNTIFPYRMSLLLPNPLQTPLTDQQASLVPLLGVGVWPNLKVRVENRSTTDNATVSVRAVRMRRVG